MWKGSNLKLLKALAIPVKSFQKGYVIAFDYAIVILKKIYLILPYRGHKKARNLSRFGAKKRILVILIKVFAILLTPIGLLRLVYTKLKSFFSNIDNTNGGYRIRFDNNDKVIVILAPIDWSYRHQRPQNLAESLVKRGYQVIYLNPTIEYVSGNRDEIVSIQANGVWVSTIRSQYRRKSFYVGVEGFPEKMAEGTAKLLEKFVSSKFYSSAIIVIGQPSWWPLAERMQGNQLLFDCMDFHAGFQEIDPLNVMHEKSLDVASDNIVVTSEFLRSSKSVQIGTSKPIALIRNGVDTGHFVPDMNDVPEGVVGYFGALAEWFDIDLVRYLVEARPRIRFEFIGLVSDPNIVNQLGNYSNVSFLGEVPNNELPERVRTWSAGLIPFKLSQLILATNPVKMYEYASMGIPTIATQIPEVEIASREVNGIYVSNSHGDYLQKLDLALELTFPDRERLSHWGKNHDWSERAEELMSHAAVVPKVSIIVLMWNQGLMTMKCLRSIVQRSDYPNLEIILVDNDSNAEESTLVTGWIENQSNQNIRYIRNSANLGFAAGNNVGLNQATGDYLVVLNNDTEVSPGWIWRSLKHFYRNPNLGILGPSTNNCGNEGRVKLHVAEHDWLSEVVPRFNFRVPHLIQANTVAFFCAFIPRKVFERIGLISEDYGRGYFEDDDYCRRAQASGYEIGIARDVFVYHKMGASFNLMEDSDKSKLFYENKEKYEAKWGSWEPHTYAFDADQS
jgi:GT2 family glycosyltransferase/glycosyltransferase involved in cell wall biosynthesis